MLDANELTVMELIRQVRLLQEQVNALTGEAVRVHLPEAGKMISVAFDRYHPNNEYAVQIEVDQACRDGVERVDILEKQRNGLRISYQGNADSADVILWIQDRPKAHE